MQICRLFMLNMNCNTVKPIILHLQIYNPFSLIKILDIVLIGIITKTYVKLKNLGQSFYYKIYRITTNLCNVNSQLGKKQTIMLPGL